VGLRVDVYRCVCGATARAFVSEGCVVVKIDRAEWHTRCTERKSRRDAPLSCPKMQAVLAKKGLRDQ
jgi:hypothetical protein